MKEVRLSSTTLGVNSLPAQDHATEIGIKLAGYRMSQSTYT